MKIELRNIKYAAFASHETDCFDAAIYIDGERAGGATNDGNGGMTIIHPRELEQRLNAYGATLPQIETDMPDPIDKSKRFAYAQTGETIVNDLVTAWLIERDFRRRISKRILYQKADAKVYQSKAAKSPGELQAWLAHPRTAEKIGAVRILNLMPLAEAIAIFREASQ